MSHKWCWRILGGLWAIAVVVNPQTALAQTDSKHSMMDVICLTDRPVIAEGDSTRLQAWAASLEGTPISEPTSFTWQVTRGRVQGSGPDVQWDLSGVKIGPKEMRKKVTATVKAVAIGVGDASCLVDVFIGKKEREESEYSTAGTRGRLRSARRYLLPNEREEKGFGLYSYLLFAAQPGSEEEKTRYLKTLEACLRMMESVEDHIKHHRRPDELNATHIPVKAVPKYSPAFAEWAANVLDAYDYTAAQKLLDKLDKTYQRGPYLVSVLKDPLADRPVPVQEHLLQDFTGKVPELVSQVVELFICRAAQQQKWTAESFQSFWLNVRNLVAVAGKVAPEVASATIMLRTNRARQAL